MLIQNISLVYELMIEILSKQTQIFKTSFFPLYVRFQLQFNTRNPTDFLHVNRVVMNQTFRPKSVSPEVLDQEKFACIISLIFLIFLKHNPPINFLHVNHFVLRKTILQYFTHAFIVFMLHMYF